MNKIKAVLILWGVVMNLCAEKVQDESIRLEEIDGREVRSVEDPLISYSGYIEKGIIPLDKGVGHKAVRFNRRIALTGAKQYGWDNPGVRISFRTDASFIGVGLYYSTNHISTSARNGKGLFFVDGQTREDWMFDSGSASVTRPPKLVRLRLPVPREKGFHDYEIVLPYGDSVQFQGLEVSPGAHFKPFHSPRTLRYVALGDSVTQGFCASRVDKTYPYLLAERKGWEMLNIGIAGRVSTPSDGEVLASLRGDVITILMGVNDWQAGRSLEQYRNNMMGVISEVRATQPHVPIYLITPLWVSERWKPASATIELEAYREVLREMVSTLEDDHLYLIEGPDLIDPSERYFDTVAVHPNDSGFALMAQRLGAVINRPE